MKPTYGKKLSKKVKQDTVFAFCMCIGACILYCAFFVFPANNQLCYGEITAEQFIEAVKTNNDAFFAAKK